MRVDVEHCERTSRSRAERDRVRQRARRRRAARTTNCLSVARMRVVVQLRPVGAEERRIGRGGEEVKEDEEEEKKEG
jgi:hypothetical protein